MATKADKKLNKKILFATDNEPTDRSYFYNECFEFNGMIFRYTIDFHNGATSHNQFIEIMTSEGTWQRIAGALNVGAYFGNPYLNNGQQKLKARDEYIAAFDKFVGAVYSNIKK